ncbi:S1 RNA-binding domain-containing protein [Streptomyces sp. NPDC002491]
MNAWTRAAAADHSRGPWRHSPDQEREAGILPVSGVSGEWERLRAAVLSATRSAPAASGSRPAARSTTRATRWARCRRGLLTEKRSAPPPGTPPDNSEDGFGGLVHDTELAGAHVEGPEHVVQVGEALTVELLEVDPARRRIALSRKQALAVAPEDAVIPDEGVDSIQPHSGRAGDCGHQRRRLRDPPGDVPRTVGEDAVQGGTDAWPRRPAGRATERLCGRAVTSLTCQVSVNGAR